MELYAKSDKNNNPTESLYDHTDWCLKVAEYIIKSLPFSNIENKRIEKDLFLAIAIHDVGKAATGFQKSLMEKDFRWGKRHEIISASFASSIADVSEESILAILTHHKTIPNSFVERLPNSLPEEQIPLDDITPIWCEMEREWYQNYEHFSNVWKKICKRIGREDLISIRRLEKLRINTFWLRRGYLNSQLDNISFEKRQYASLLRGLLITCDHLGSSHQIPPSVPQLNNFILTENALRNFQTRSETFGNTIIHAPTGSGKTIAALLWARTNQNTNGRLYYCLPNKASINAMFETLKQYYGNDYVGILHSDAVAALYIRMEDDQTSRRQYLAKDKAGLAREMYFPFRVCTPHQILRYVLRGRGWENMLAEFPNSCFIFDEIHAYEPRITGLVIATAKFLKRLNASVAFLSATMPSFLVKLLKDNLEELKIIRPNENIDSDREILEKKRHVVAIQKGDMFENRQFIIDKIKNSTSTLIVCNNVLTAQRIFRELEKEFLNNVVLLHSRFNKKDRAEIEKSLTKSPPKILVATQVVEVSLNVDYEQAFLEPAPIDALIQRMGRVNRFAQNKRFKIGIETGNLFTNVYIMDSQAHSFNIYNKSMVDKTLDQFKELSGRPITETDLMNKADTVYGDGYQGDDQKEFLDGLNHPDIIEFENNIIAGTHRSWVDDVIEKSDNTVEVLPLSYKKEYDKLQDDGSYVESSLLLVPIRYSSLFKLKNKVNKQSEPWIVDAKYNSKVGLDIYTE